MSRSSRSPYEPSEPELIPSGSVAPSSDEIELKVQQVQDQLLSLKRQQEEIERQKRELEELSRKQHEFEEGRDEILEKLTRGLVLLERQEFEAKRELDQIQLVRENFSDQLGQIQAINPSRWESHALMSELTKALAHIDQAKAIHSQARARLSALRSVDHGENDIPSDLDSPLHSAEKSFFAMAKEGFAYSFPALLAALLFLIFFLLVHRN